MDIGEYGRRFKDNKKQKVIRPAKIQWQDKYENVKKIISFSLWGDCELYSAGAIENAIAASYVYPEFECWFYVGEGVNEKHLEILDKFRNTKVIKRKDEPNLMYNMFWRFEPAFKTDNIVLVRDCDAVVSLKERMAVDEWLNSKYDFHIMRDHPKFHFGHYPIIGCMWGCKNGILKGLKIYDEWMKKQEGKFFADQNMLKEVYKEIKDKCLVHSSKNEKMDESEDVVEFPLKSAKKLGQHDNYNVDNIIGSTPKDKNRKLDNEVKKFELDFDKYAYYINLDVSVNRRKYFEQEIIPKLGNIKRFSGIIPQDKGSFDKIGTRGCAESHLHIIKTAKENSWPYVIIFEDDFALSDGFDIDVINEFLSQENWSIFYFYTKATPYSMLKYENKQNLNKDLYFFKKLDGYNFYKCVPRCTCGYVINSKFYDYILNNNAKNHIDIMLVSSFRFENPYCVDGMSFHKDGYSVRNMVKYNKDGTLSTILNKT